MTSPAVIPAVIVRFTAQEWPLYRTLRLRALTDSPEAFATTLEEAERRTEAQWVEQLSSGARSGGDHPIRAEVAGEGVGMAWTTLAEANPSHPHPHEAQLYQMWVDPAHRSVGIGGLLLRASIDWARSREVTQIALEVAADNEAATSLYTAAGFVVSGDPEPLRPGSSRRVVPMRLRLVPDRD